MWELKHTSGNHGVCTSDPRTAFSRRAERPVARGRSSKRALFAEDRRRRSPHLSWANAESGAKTGMRKEDEELEVVRVELVPTKALGFSKHCLMRLSLFGDLFVPVLVLA